MVLSDRDILNRIERGVIESFTHVDNRSGIGIDPFDPTQVQPASIDLKLADEWLYYPDEWLYYPPAYQDRHIDLNFVSTVKTWSQKSTDYLLHPRDLVLASTVEYIRVPSDLVARVEGKSSLARLGLSVHLTAGFIDPGFEGKITLEITNNNNCPILLHAFKPICQITFQTLTSPAEFPYGHERLKSKYQGQKRVQGSLYTG